MHTVSASLNDSPKLPLPRGQEFSLKFLTFFSRQPQSVDLFCWSLPSKFLTHYEPLYLALSSVTLPLHHI